MRTTQLRTALTATALVGGLSLPQLLSGSTPAFAGGHQLASLVDPLGLVSRLASPIARLVPTAAAPVAAALAPVVSATVRAARSLTTGAVTLHLDGATMGRYAAMVTALPGQKLNFAATAPGLDELTAADRGQVLRWELGDGQSAPMDAAGTLVAPQKAGLETLRLAAWTPDLEGNWTRGATLREISLVTLVPFDAKRGGELNGYQIGTYPFESGQTYRTGYEPLPGFIELTPATAAAPVSAHFKVGDFACKQPAGSDGRRYLYLRPALIEKLEHVIAEMERVGIPVQHVQVMSGYRTPYYNAAIGNTTTWSRHTFGDAADIFLDNNHDGRMDDLNGDGRSDERDAEVITRIVERLEREDAGVQIGGMGAYKPTDSHGPFVHIDARGTAARW